MKSLNEKIKEAKEAYNKRYVVRLENSDKLDLNLLMKILYLNDTISYGTTIKGDALLIVCRTHEDASAMAKIFNEEFGHCAELI